ncbi:uncharacterised protein [Colletotrichum tofieldiae]|nr:uncharacterised protein [Colletotrichum tofieldiae]
MSFDATQYSRPLGLVADVASLTAGTRTYFAQPPKKEPSADEQSYVFNETASYTLLDNPSAAELMQCAARSPTPEAILQKIALKTSDAETRLLWELGVHMTILLMEKFLATQQFDLAIRMARMIFDPTVNGSNPRDCWLFPPFMEDGLSLKSTRDLLEDMVPAAEGTSGGEFKHMSYHEVQVAEWQANPFNAHSIARGRPVTYMKRIVIKYIETLVAAGDQIFRQASLEAIPLALQRYIEASHLFGPAMRRVKRLGRRPTKTFNDILGKTDLFSNARVDLELELPFSCVRAAPGLWPRRRSMPARGLWVSCPRRTLACL